MCYRTNIKRQRKRKKQQMSDTENRVSNTSEDGYMGKNKRRTAVVAVVTIILFSMFVLLLVRYGIWPFSDRSSGEGSGPKAITEGLVHNDNGKSQSQSKENSKLSSSRRNERDNENQSKKGDESDVKLYG